MKERFYKYLPFVVGFVIVWFVVSPPEFLGDTTLARIVLAVPLAALLLLGALTFLVSANLPTDLQMTPTDQSAISDQLVDLFNQYQAAGFQLAGAPLRVELMTSAVVIPLIDSEQRCFGTIYRTNTVPPKTSNDIVSMLEPHGGLTTGCAAEGAALPAGPNVYFQVLEGADVQTMYDRHLKALDYLGRQGIRCRPLEGQLFADEFRSAIAQQREHFFTNPLWHTLVVLWRSTTGKTPHLGPLHQQAIVQRTLPGANTLD